MIAEEKRHPRYPQQDMVKVFIKTAPYTCIKIKPSQTNSKITLLLEVLCIQTLTTLVYQLLSKKGFLAQTLQ